MTQKTQWTEKNVKGAKPIVTDEWSSQDIEMFRRGLNVQNDLDPNDTKTITVSFGKLEYTHFQYDTHILLIYEMEVLDANKGIIRKPLFRQVIKMPEIVRRKIAERNAAAN